VENDRHDWCNGTCETCSENPADLAGAPIGMYHCSGCGMMLLAGSSKHPTCKEMDDGLPS
jgi:hypothetical protein